MVIGLVLGCELVSGSGVVNESSSSSSESNVSWFISLTTLYYYIESIYMSSLEDFEEATDFAGISPMQLTQSLIGFHSFGSSLVRK